MIGVASFDNTHVNLPAFTVSPDSPPIGYQNAAGAPPRRSPARSRWLATGTPASTDRRVHAAACRQPEWQVALIRRGTCTFYQKAFNAQRPAPPVSCSTTTWPAAWARRSRARRQSRFRS